jgi:ribosomal-protein-serine acetyltransferase
MLVQSLPLRSLSGISIIPVAVEHAAAFASLIQQNTQHLQAYLPAVAHLSSIEAAENHLRLAVERASQTEIFEWHIFVGDALCGSVRLKDIDMNNRKAEIGYFIGQQFTGKGIVSAAVSTVLEFCFGPLHLNRIELRCASGNEASKRVAERLGFAHEGVLRQGEFLNGLFVDQDVYGLLATDFENRFSDETAKSCLPLAAIAAAMRTGGSDWPGGEVVGC